MTLSTYVAFRGAVEPQELHDFVNRELLHAGPDVRITRSETSIANDPGQGLSAWAITHYAVPGTTVEWWTPDDEPARYWTDLYGDEGRARWEESQAEDRERYARYPEGITAYVDFDTTYGFRGPAGEGCTVLHAGFIVRLFHEFAVPRGLELVWQNEYSGEWNEGLSGMEAFLGDGDDAQAWFTGTVLPLIDKLVKEQD